MSMMGWSRLKKSTGLGVERLNWDERLMTGLLVIVLLAGLLAGIAFVCLIPVAVFSAVTRIVEKNDAANLMAATLVNKSTQVGWFELRPISRGAFGAPLLLDKGNNWYSSTFEVYRKDTPWVKCGGIVWANTKTKAVKIESIFPIPGCEWLYG